MKSILPLTLSLAVLVFATGCAPEVGSKRWCENMEEKPKGDWSMNEAGEFAKHCLFTNGEQ